jgi:hypothetical protein
MFCPNRGSEQFQMTVTVYIHIGMHKTGTSSIQVELTRARHLIERGGFYYPRNCIPDWAPYGQHEVPWLVVKDERKIPENALGTWSLSPVQKQEKLKTLTDEMRSSGFGKVILSSEEFDTLDIGEIEALAEAFEGFKLVPVVFIRNLSDFVESGYGTAVVHSNYAEPIQHFAANQRSRLDIYKMLKDWSSICNEDQIIAASYDDPHLKADAVLSFLRFLGLSAADIEPHRLPLQNESFPAFIVELLRIVRNNVLNAETRSDWENHLLQQTFPRSARSRYTLMPPFLKNQLDTLYMTELDQIAKDPDVAGKILGSLIIPETPERVFLSDFSKVLRAYDAEVCSRGVGA